MSLKDISNKLKEVVLLGGTIEDRTLYRWKLPYKEGRELDGDIRNIPFEDFIEPLHWGEEGWNKIVEVKRFMSEDFDTLSDKEKMEHMVWMYCGFFYSYQSQNNGFYPPLDFSERVKKGQLKEGDLDRNLIFGNGVCYLDTYEVGKVVHSHIGQNLKLVLSTLQNLNSSLLEGWEFRTEEKTQMNLSEIEHLQHRLGYSYGECLILENENIGRIHLYEDKNSTENEIWLELIEVWGKRTLNGEEKGSVGRSLLTLLNRITKGYDIVLKLNVGRISREGNKTPHNKKKLVEWYQKNGFTLEGDIDLGLVPMSNIGIVEEYWNRLEEEGKDQKRLDSIQKKVGEVEKVDITTDNISEVFKQ